MSLESIKNTATSVVNSKIAEKKDGLLTPEQEGPYVQFEKCKHTEITCKYIDAYGNCSFETCQIDNIEVPRVKLWYFKCIICNRPDSAVPAELRAPICHSCVERMQELEHLPNTCRYCGATISSPPKWMFSGICDECESIIGEMIQHKKARGLW